jgi:hypothetical protein
MRHQLLKEIFVDESSPLGRKGGGLEIDKKRMRTGGLFLRFCLFQAGDAASFFKFTTLTQQFYPLESLENRALGRGASSGFETGML